MPSALRSLPPRSSSSLEPLKEEHDATLFEAPSELVCPITHAVFLDPVLTQAGHAYERKSIEQHLRTTDTDPMSRQPLLNPSLTPVFVLKSRALEYREKTARACIEKACSVSPPRPPIEYLRRAVELCSDAGFLPKGLTRAVVEYVNSHFSNVYDRLSLELFARGLFENGYRDRAAAVYFHLLVTEEDKTAQADLLKRCLSCWQASGTTSGSGGGSSGSGGGQSSQLVHHPGVATTSKDIDSHVFEKLVQMIDTKGSQFIWLLEISSEAGLGNNFLARLCEHILFPSPSSLSSSNLSDSFSGAGASTRSSKTLVRGSLPWETEKEVLLKYCFILTTGVKEEQAEMNNKIINFEAKLSSNGRGRGRKGSFGRLWHANSSNTDYNNEEEEDANDGSIDDGGLGNPVHNALVVLRRVVRHPFVMVPCAAVALFGDPHHPLVRSTLVVPFVALMQHGGSGGDGGGGRRGGGWGGRFSSSSFEAMPESPSRQDVAAVVGQANISNSSDGASNKKESE